MTYGIKLPLTKENLLAKINSYSIFKKYCTGFEDIGKAFFSPLRDTDNNPSAFIVYYEDDLLFNDFGKGSYRAISFVMELFNLSFMEALQKINADFDLGLKSDSNYIPTTVYKKEEIPSDIKINRGPCVISIKRREFQDYDDEYWFERYGISRETLTKFQVSPISHFKINDLLYFAHRHAYSYDYYWEDQVFRRKIYQPLSVNKWYSNGGLVVQGEGMLPREGDLLIITSSLKDVMTLYELGYTAIAPTSESTFVPESYFIKQNSRFKRILSFMDSDDAGLEANKKLSDKWGIGYISIPIRYKAKDISDFVKNNGQLSAKNLLVGLIN